MKTGFQYAGDGTHTHSVLSFAAPPAAKNLLPGIQKEVQVFCVLLFEAGSALAVVPLFYPLLSPGLSPALPFHILYLRMFSESEGDEFMTHLARRQRNNFLS